VNTARQDCPTVYVSGNITTNVIHVKKRSKNMDACFHKDYSRHMAHLIQAVTIPWYNACADYAIQLARGLKSTGHRVTVTGGPDTPAIGKAREYGIDVFAPGDPGSANPVALIRLAGAYRSYARETGATAVNAHHGRDHLVWAAALANTGIPLLRTSGNQIPPKVHPGTRLIQSRTSGIIASCGTVRSYYAEGFGIDPGDIPVVNGGVDGVLFSPANRNRELRRTFGIPDDAFVFGIIGRFSPVKGHRFFFEAASRAARTRPHLRFLAAGWDAQLSGRDIENMAVKAGIIERTCFPGRSSDVRKLIGAVDVGVVASVGSETVCRIALEYMAMGVPVIAAGTNVVPELVPDGVAGIIVPPGDPDALADAMERLADSPETAAELGANGRALVERDYTLERFAMKTLEAYGSMSIHVR
jgi:glycosyltransferase involved in cell wall biosynthesis